MRGEREIACEERDADQRGRDDGDRPRPVRRHLRHHRTEQPYQREPAMPTTAPAAARRIPRSQHEPEHIPHLRAERDAHADLARAPGDDVRDHAVNDMRLSFALRLTATGYDLELACVTNGAVGT